MTRTHTHTHACNTRLPLPAHTGIVTLGVSCTFCSREYAWSPAWLRACLCAWVVGACLLGCLPALVPACWRVWVICRPRDGCTKAVRLFQCVEGVRFWSQDGLLILLVALPSFPSFVFSFFRVLCRLMMGVLARFLMVVIGGLFPDFSA